VLLEPAPAITGTRPLASSTHDLDDALVLVMAQRRALAGGADRNEAVAALSICHSTSARKASSSSAPSLNGVTSAGRDFAAVAGQRGASGYRN
jgi:hypothetical protein